MAVICDPLLLHIDLLSYDRRCVHAVFVTFDLATSSVGKTVYRCLYLKHLRERNHDFLTECGPTMIVMSGVLTGVAWTLASALSRFKRECTHSCLRRIDAYAYWLD